MCRSASPTTCFSSPLRYFAPPHTLQPHTRGSLFNPQYLQSEIIVEISNQMKNIFFFLLLLLLSGAAGNLWIEGTTGTVVMRRAVRLPHVGGGFPTQEASAASLFPHDGALLLLSEV